MNKNNYMTQIKFKNKKLTIEQLPVSFLARKISTPFYLYSKKQIKDNFLKFKKSFSNIDPLICFSVKSNSNSSILKLLKTLGSGADVVSGGELIKVLNSGIKPQKIVFSGVGKNADELQLAIKKKILLINAESESEVILINKISKAQKKITSIGLRLNPNIKAQTHKKISTGKTDDKFGLSKKDLISVINKIKKLKNVKLNSISVHIGSQILKETPFKKTLKVIERILKKTKINLKYIDLGGGFGISYNKKVKEIKLKDYPKLVEKFKNKFNCKIIFEPGRAIVGNTGILVSKIQYIKKTASKIFIILDAGMNDFMRPALYDAQHEIVPITKRNSYSKKVMEFVGPICESSCKFKIYKSFQILSEKDFVAIKDVGAYGSVLASNYNSKPLPAEVWVDRNKFKIIRKRQDLNKIIKY